MAKTGFAKDKSSLFFNDLANKLIMNNNDGILAYDKNLKCILWNPAMESISGIKKELVLNRHLFDFVENINLSESDNYFLKVLEGEEFFVEKNQYKFYSKREKGFYNIKYLPVQDEMGVVVGGMAVIQEVTSQVETQNEFKDNKQLLTYSQEIAGIGSYEHNLKNNKVKLSGEICRFLGFENVVELEMEQFEKNIHEEDIGFYKSTLSKILSDQESYDVEYRHLMYDGTFRYIWIKGKVIFSEKGKPEKLIGAAMDITEKKMIEEEFRNKNIAILNAYKKLEKAQEELKVLNTDLEKIVEERTKELYLSEERFKMVSYATNDAFWDWDIINNNVWWSESFKSILGFNNELVESGMEFLQEKIHPDDLERVKESFSKVIEERLTQNSIEYRLIRSDGSVVFVYDRSYTLMDENGIPIRMIGSIMDLTPLKNVQDELFLKNQELKKVNDYLDNFVYAAAHDLRSPVANLKLLFNLLEKTSDFQSKEKYLDAIHQAVIRLDNTLNGLVQVIEIQSQSGNGFNIINFKGVLEGIKAEFLPAIKKKKVTFHVDFKACEAINHIEAYIVSIMKNLVSNAIKYSAEERKPVINISTQKVDDYILLQISDNGIGLDLKKYGNNLFKPFNRFTNKAEGQGIGLHLIKSMVEKNGGRITVESQVNKGTTFNVYLKEFINK